MWSIFGILPALNFGKRKKQEKRKAEEKRQEELHQARMRNVKIPAYQTRLSSLTGSATSHRMGTKSPRPPDSLLDPMNIASPLSPLHQTIFYPSHSPSPDPERSYDCSPYQTPSHSSPHSSSHDPGSSCSSSSSSSDYSSSSSSDSGSSSGGNDW